MELQKNEDQGSIESTNHDTNGMVSNMNSTMEKHPKETVGQNTTLSQRAPGCL